MIKENIDLIVEQKIERLPHGVDIITPQDNIPKEIQAEWLTKLLSTMYVEHGITKRREGLMRDIESGDCRLWFAARGDALIGSAALVKQSDGSVEVGRAVSLESGVGGLLMLMAAQQHLSESDSPVVAEVRISDNFGGVPSGEATQVVCFKHLGLNPHATVPAFNHGEPNRQEMFVFSSSSKTYSINPAFFPDDGASLKLLDETAVAMSRSSFQNGFEIRKSSERHSISKWSVVGTQPFSILVPDNGGVKFSTALNEAEKGSPFVLIPMSASPLNISSMLECLNQGFVPCGFDRNQDSESFPVLLMGRLRKGTRLAPIKILSGLIDSEAERAINKINNKFRSAIR